MTGRDKETKRARLRAPLLDFAEPALGLEPDLTVGGPGQEVVHPPPGVVLRMKGKGRAVKGRWKVQEGRW